MLSIYTGLSIYTAKEHGNKWKENQTKIMLADGHPAKSILTAIGISNTTVSKYRKILRITDREMRLRSKYGVKETRRRCS